MSRQTIPYRELPPPPDRRFINAVRGAVQVLGWSVALGGLGLICAVLSHKSG